MNTYTYTPIITESTKNTFFDYINSIKIDSIDFYSVGIANTAQKKFSSITSQLDWQTIFYKKQFGKHDPLTKANLFSRRKIVPFSEVDYIDSSGKEVMRQRRLHGISNGLTFIHKEKQLKYMIMLTTGFSKFDHFTFLKKYYSKLDRLTHDLTKIIENDIHQLFLK
ncbi:MAG: hypothetical protein V4700_05070 [Pseudomonadota bacterium]